jgi:MFS family permease
VWLREPGHAVVAPVGASITARPLRDEQIWRISISGGLLGFVQLTLLGFVVLFLHEERGFSPTGAGAVLAAITLSGAALRVMLGYWSDRLGQRLAPLRVVTIVLALALAVVPAAARAPSGVLVGSLVAAGGVAAGWNSLAFTAVAERAGRARNGMALWLQQTVLGIVGATTSLVFSTAVTELSWRGAFALLPLFPVLAFVARGRPPEQEPDVLGAK